MAIVACSAIFSAAWLGGCALGFNPERDPSTINIPADGMLAPLRIVHHVPFVQVTIGDSPPLWFAIDTGAFSTIIDDDAAAAAGVKSAMRFGTQVTSAGSTFGRMDLAQFDEMRIGGATFGGFEGLVTDLAPLARSVDHPFDGVIGMPLIRRGVWTIDYPSQTLRIDANMPDLAGDPRTIQFLWSGETPAIEIHAGETALMAEIDTGSSSGLDLSEEDAQRVPLEDGANVSVAHMTVSGRVSEHLVRLEADLSIGPIVLHQPLVYRSRFTMFGGEILQRCVMTIDGARQLVRIEKVE